MRDIVPAGQGPSPIRHPSDTGVERPALWTPEGTERWLTETISSCAWLPHFRLCC
jgi:hypothetical protein